MPQPGHPSGTMAMRALGGGGGFASVHKSLACPPRTMEDLLKVLVTHHSQPKRQSTTSLTLRSKGTGLQVETGFQDAVQCLAKLLSYLPHCPPGPNLLSWIWWRLTAHETTPPHCAPRCRAIIHCHGFPGSQSFLLINPQPHPHLEDPNPLLYLSVVTNIDFDIPRELSGVFPTSQFWPDMLPQGGAF